MAEQTTDTSNNETGEDTGVKPEDLYDDKGGAPEGKEPTGNEPEGDEPKGDEPDGDGKEGDEPNGKEGEGDDKGDDDVVPEKYDLKIAEDSLLDQNDMDRIAAYSKELELTNEDAQLVAEMESEAIGRYHEKLEKEVETIHDGWLKTAESDKEIGGDAFKENVELAHRVVDKFGSEGFTQMLKDSNYGNHPEVIRVFARIGKLMAEDQAVFPKGHGTEEKSMEETFYGSNNN